MERFCGITGKVDLCRRIVNTRRVPVQRAVERDEIPYPYKVQDTTLRPLLNITIKSTIVVRSRSRSCSGGDICGTTPAFRSDVNIAIVAIRNSFWFNIVKKQRTNAKSERSKCCGLAISSRQIYAMIGVELRTHGEIFVKSWRRKCSFAIDSYSSKDVVYQSV